MSKIGTVQLRDIQGDTFTSLHLIQQWMTQADNEELNILCFPECFLQGYTLNKHETQQRALDLTSDRFQEILSKLKGYRVTIILGLVEVADGNFFNTAAVIRQGQLIGKYRKAHLFEQNFKPGNHYPLFESRGLNFGINICYDARFPEGAETLAKQGAQVIFYPLNNRLPEEKAIKYRDKHLPNLIARAEETGCWIVSSDVIDHGDTHIGYGCTVIVSPNGKVSSRVKELTEGLITADFREPIE